MPVAVWCILIAAILPIVSVFPAKLNRQFDNADPRAPGYWKDGFRARARAAEINGFEAFPFFAVAVIVGLWQGGSVEWVDRLAVLFILMRLVFIFCYYTDRATPRSIAWLVGFLSAAGIFTSPLWSV